MQEKIQKNEIKLGMFVSELDRPWEESPFMMQGFLLQSPEEVAEVRECCDFVYIDPSRSEVSVRPAIKHPVAYKPATEVTRSQVVSNSAGTEFPSDRQLEPRRSDDSMGIDLDVEHHLANGDVKKGHERVREIRAAKDAHKLLQLPGEFVEYKTTSPVEQEFQTAKEVRSQLHGALKTTFERFKKNERLSLSAVKDSTKSMVDSIVRNPDAAHLLCLLKEKDSFSYSHSISASILAVLFGRHLGLNEEELNTLALATLLLDVGKMNLPTGLLEKSGQLSFPEAKVLRKHVTHSIEMLKQADGLDIEVLAIIEGHHERFDGKGYPQGLVGAEIPVFARMAAIIDFYDAITHERPYRKPVSPCYAVNALYDRQGSQFQQELVEEFIHCLGVYPTGSLVLLSSGEVGIVFEQNNLRRLRPKILVVRNQEKKEINPPVTRDLEYEKTDDKGSRLFILTALEPGAYGISDEDYYL